MYCANCGVKLADGQKLCPVCNTRAYHPDLPRSDASPSYPNKEFQSEEYNRRGLLFVISILWFIPFALPVIFELSWHATVTWSGLVAGGVLLAYILVVLPLWFKHAPPIIFVASDFAAILLYLLYIDIQNHGGRWFLRFAFPVTGVFALICCAVVTLCFYIRRGYLYIFGGASIALGAWTVLIEFLIWVAFGVVSPVFWSACSFASLFVIGMLLIVIAMVKPLKESLKKKFFLG
ncbi:MAG: hypothetical protein IIX69_02835 [Clostridia bacterium]|nr:hypothetical protein [Clostridia bacterium]MBQ1935077.1 hypothetical protein [Clostridia bacterium]MBQ5808925.1 hypothetical protein [Clostridia bacterium]MBR0326206.1 hypothetical protein [Clostridia bacterium]